MAKIKGAIVVDTERCKGCNLCVVACPLNVIALTKDCLLYTSDVPLGAGMSSSAALESTYAYALNDLFGDNKIDKFELAKVGQATEHNYCGVNCGIMDQMCIRDRAGPPSSLFTAI